MRHLLAYLFMLYAQCHAQKSFMGTTLLLQKGKPVEVKELKAIFTLKECGRAYLVGKNNQSAGERPYCNLSVSYKEKTLFLSNTDPVFLDAYQVRVTGINPWNTEERGIPANGCKLDIFLSPVVQLLTQYGWETDSIVNEQTFSFPEKFTGIPWCHYAAATKQINFDLETLHGKTVQLQKVQLKQKGERSREHIFAHIVVMDNKAITGWLSAPHVAPGIGALNMEKSRLSNW